MVWNRELKKIEKQSSPALSLVSFPQIHTHMHTYNHTHTQTHTHTDTHTHRHTHTLMAALRMCSRSNKDKIIKQQNILQSKV